MTRTTLEDSAHAILLGVLVMLLLQLGAIGRAAINGERIGAAPAAGPTWQEVCVEQCVRWCGGQFGPLLPGEREECLRWVPASQVQTDEEAAAARLAMRGSLLRDLDGRLVATNPIELPVDVVGAEQHAPKHRAEEHYQDAHHGERQVALGEHHPPAGGT